MDLSKIKLIVSDMDGTLLNGHEQPSTLFFEQFEILKKQGVHFAAASGRQYNSIAHKLAPIKDEITIIGENGGVAKRKDKLIHLQTMNPTSILDIIPTLRKIDDIFVILCGQHSAFIESKDPKLIGMFQEYYGTHEIVEDLTRVIADTPILKIALYHPKSSEQFIYPELKSFEASFLLKISGKNWLDLSSPTSNKGTALKIVQQKMNITPEETAVFGDYLNDLEMLQCAYFSFAMQNAHPEVKKIARFETTSHNDLGVEKVIAEIIKAKS
jgi:Cof subfamily protein (haloacid dehalogenase superfamily)